MVAIDARLIGAGATGDSTYWLGLIHGLARLRPRFRIVLFSNAPLPAPVPGGFEVRVVRARSPRWWSLVSFPLAARQLGARAIHTQYALSPLVGARGVTTIHDVSFLIEPAWFRPKDRFLLRTTVPSSARRAARVITVSESSQLEISFHLKLPKSQIVVTPLALNPAFSPPDQFNPVPDAQPYLLAVGTVWPRKNLRLALEAVERLPADLPHRLKVVGKSGWGDLPAGPRAERLGYVSDMELARLYAGASALIVPSLHEGFGLTLLEAFAFGCPVVCGTGGALLETGGDAVLALPDYRVETWAAGIEALLRDSGKVETLRARGRERVRQFDWQETARLTAEVYDEVSH